MSLSTDVPAPPWGPGFLRLNSWAYRIEYAAASTAILLILFVWRLLILRQLPAPEVALTIFWIVWPDLASFPPIGLASRGSREWPNWGPRVYNLFHSLLVWAVVFVTWSLLSGGINWPLLGGAGHITTDRAVGFYLRAPGRPSEAPAVPE